MRIPLQNNIASLTTIGVVCLVLTIAALSACQDDPFKQGKILYEIHCGNCHGLKGEGLGQLIPPLAGADFFTQRIKEIPCMIVRGYKGQLTVNGKMYSTNAMPPNEKLTEFEITNILNYISSSWYPDKKFIKLDDVREDLKQCPYSVH